MVRFKKRYEKVISGLLHCVKVLSLKRPIQRHWYSMGWKQASQISWSIHSWTEHYFRSISTKRFPGSIQSLLLRLESRVFLHHLASLQDVNLCENIQWVSGIGGNSRGAWGDRGPEVLDVLVRGGNSFGFRACLFVRYMQLYIILYNYIY